MKQAQLKHLNDGNTSGESLKNGKQAACHNMASLGHNELTYYSSTFDIYLNKFTRHCAKIISFEDMVMDSGMDISNKFQETIIH